MEGYHSFYEGSSAYGLKANHGQGSSFLGFPTEYRASPGEFALTTDPRTANQLKAVSDKLSTGAKAIEITGITPQILDAIPKQQFQEINRLKKILGNTVELTFHGPLIEPTGVGQERWDENQRRAAETQMWNAVERSHALDPAGNVIVTFHSSNGLPDPITRIAKRDAKGNVIRNDKGLAEEEEVSMLAIDERTGRVVQIAKPRKNYLIDEPTNLNTELERQNKEAWQRTLSQLNFNAQRARGELSRVFAADESDFSEEAKKRVGNIPEFYKFSKQKPKEYEDVLKSLPQADVSHIKEAVNSLNFGETITRESYGDLQEMFSQAYEVIKDDPKRRDDKEKLDDYKKEVGGVLEKMKNDPAKIREFSEAITKGIRILDSIHEVPKVFKPLEKFAIEKAGITFGNIAFKSYQKFKDNSPIISIENPPVGMGLTRASQLAGLVEKAKEVFVESAMEKGMDRKKAQDQADKLIGNTWDVGHINMMKKYGYDDADVLAETSKLKKNIKHIHLSDNFGMEHTELPMGMGNVPTQQHMKILRDVEKKFEKEFGNKFTKVIETGGPWFQFFQKSPLNETLQAFGSPIYPMNMAPYWNQNAAFQNTSYFAGYGMNPDIHHSIYGAGFSALPVELGGQIPGTRNRLSGAPME